MNIQKDLFADFALNIYLLAGHFIFQTNFRLRLTDFINIL